MSITAGIAKSQSLAFVNTPKTCVVKKCMNLSHLLVPIIEILPQAYCAIAANHLCPIFRGAKWPVLL